MADQEKPQDPPQVAASQTQEPDTTKPEEQPTATESAPAPEPAAEPDATTAVPPAAASSTDSAPAAPAPTSAPAAETSAAASTEPAPVPTAAPEAKSEAQPEAKPEQPAAPAPTSTEAGAKEEKNESSKPGYFTKTPALETLFDRLPTILHETGYEEIWGVPLKSDATDIPTVNVLVKFLRANGGNAKLAEEQLRKALAWRKDIGILTLVDASKSSYDAAKFGGLGYLTRYEREGKDDLIITWNLYGAVKKIDETFGDITEFIKWRAALMELSVQELKLDQSTSVIDYDREDPYQLVQVHDYLNVSFLRMNPKIRAATQKTIEVFSTAYPEVLREKFFVNVPAIMGWVFSLVKLFVNENTSRKFHPISNGNNLAREFPGLVEKFPKAYGGGGPDLEGSARTVPLKE